MRRSELADALRDLFCDSGFLTRKACDLIPDREVISSYNLCARCGGPGINPLELDAFIRGSSSVSEILEFIESHDDDRHPFDFEFDEHILKKFEEARIDPEFLASSISSRLVKKGIKLAAGKAALGGDLIVHYYFDAESSGGKPCISFVTQEDYEEFMGSSASVYQDSLPRGFSMPPEEDFN